MYHMYRFFVRTRQGVRVCVCACVFLHHGEREGWGICEIKEIGPSQEANGQTVDDRYIRFMRQRNTRAC